MQAIHCAIVGSGNIGTDLMVKILRRASKGHGPLKLAVMVGDTVFPLSTGGSEDAIRKSIDTTPAAVQRDVPGYRLKQAVQFDQVDDTPMGAGRKTTAFLDIVVDIALDLQA